jgi:hypothetical protein
MNNYTIELIKLAKKLDRPLEVQYADQTYKYLVSINNVVYKDKHLRQSISGIGFTIEDACYDYIRKCRGGELDNYMTNKVIEVI